MPKTGAAARGTLERRASLGFAAPPASWCRPAPPTWTGQRARSPRRQPVQLTLQHRHPHQQHHQPPSSSPPQQQQKQRQVQLRQERRREFEQRRRQAPREDPAAVHVAGDSAAGTAGVGAPRKEDHARALDDKGATMAPMAGAADKSRREAYVSAMRRSLDERCVGADCSFWNAMQDEARAAAADEPLLASFMFATVLNHRTLCGALAFHLANKLSSPAMPATQLMRLFTEVMHLPTSAAAQDERTAAAASQWSACVQQDLLAVMERDPACERFIDCLCYYKGFHALQAHRVAHELWRQRRSSLAYHLQSQVSKELQVDIHPGATIGPGAFLDHATGVVIGETATIGKNVSMLQQVTLGGSGSKHGVRHPQIGDGVLIGAGATILGAVSIGDGVQIGACSLVLENIPPQSTVVGVPAKVIKRNDPSGVAEKVVPALEMKHERCLQADGTEPTNDLADGTSL